MESNQNVWMKGKASDQKMKFCMFNVWLVLVVYQANENCQYLDHRDLSVGRELCISLCLPGSD